MSTTLPCQTGDGLAIFDQMLNHRWASHQSKRRLEAAYRQCKPICDACPFREQCLATSGRDYELGMVAGLTDGERAEMFGATA